jgi:hypothetical protein
MKSNNCCKQKIYILEEADFQYLSAGEFKPDPKLVKLFKSKSPWESENAIAKQKLIQIRKIEVN